MEIGKLSKLWDSSGWQARFTAPASSTDFTCMGDDGIVWIFGDYTHIVATQSLSRPLSLADTSALYLLGFIWTRPALFSPLPASATCMCCSHVAQSAATSKTRCTQYSRRFWLASLAGARELLLLVPWWLVCTLLR
jgi:hypothetical protein